MLFNKEKRRFVRKIKRIKREMKANNIKIKMLSHKCISTHCRANSLIEEIELVNHRLDMKLFLLEGEYEIRKRINYWD